MDPVRAPAARGLAVPWIITVRMARNPSLGQEGGHGMSTSGRAPCLDVPITIWSLDLVLWRVSGIGRCLLIAVHITAVPRFSVVFRTFAFACGPCVTWFDGEGLPLRCATVASSTAAPTLQPLHRPADHQSSHAPQGTGSVVDAPASGALEYLNAMVHFVF
eukprot:CAMPEP_0174368272 /NCGR_PEP_ID=MMETSP0811_2-20130205/88481_1 /TAXON_ID=73025 ORGANISM="Eutreptiella gymnastica-like, Strain CCMP1594" /NCGR_SAMPLE_ID=MMETSP0811_2 /ASSEMBLY_ACC=CAM_ASM_000667 /LENGTH=160 /DNA_ID=CAMNT_0015511629 /DNA_START=25 /DNA_END=507 /DNA_ORIENTATION=-